jgi:hypothetical protein
LKQLFIKYCKLSAIPVSYLLPTLIVLNLEGNLITEIKSDDFTALTKLEYLSLKDVKITQIARGAFDALNLKDLEISTVFDMPDAFDFGVFIPMTNLLRVLLWSRRVLEGPGDCTGNFDMLELNAVDLANRCSPSGSKCLGCAVACTEDRFHNGAENCPVPPPPPSSGSSGLSGGAIGGIVAGAVVFVAAGGYVLHKNL